MDHELKISTTPNNWVDTVDVKSDTAVTLFFKLLTKGNKSFVIEFPKTTPGEAKTSPVIDDSAWSAVKVQTSPPNANITCSPSKNLREFGITIKGQEVPAEVILQLSFTTAKISLPFTLINRFTLRFKDSDKQWVVLNNGPAINLTVDLAPPTIREFKTSKAVLINDETFEFKWNVDHADSIVIEYGTGQDKKTIGPLSPDGKLADLSFPEDERRYTLRATNQYSAISRSVLIKRNTADAIKTVTGAPFGVDGILMNLFKVSGSAGAELLYALVLYKAAKDVLVWQTEDGLNWERSDIPSFNGTNTRVPLEFAGCSSIVFNNMLYLIGGSRYDTNFRNTDIYFYNFDKSAKPGGWQKFRNAVTYGERMGQAVIPVGKDRAGELWLLGGSGPQGALNDIHILKGNEWRASDLKLKHPLCMHQVINNHTGLLQVFGGFGHLPGEPDRKITDSVFCNPESTPIEWGPFDWPRPIADPAEKNIAFIDLNLSTCTVADCCGERFVFTLFKNAENTWRHEVYRVLNNLELEFILTGKFLQPDSFISVQAVSFRNVIWLCVVGDDGTLNSNPLQYFVYVPTKKSAQQ